MTHEVKNPDTHVVAFLDGATDEYNSAKEKLTALGVNFDSADSNLVIVCKNMTVDQMDSFVDSYGIALPLGLTGIRAIGAVDDRAQGEDIARLGIDEWLRRNPLYAQEVQGQA